MADIKKTEAEILFPEQVIDGVVVRPWTWDGFEAVLPILIRVAKLFEDGGIEWDQFQEAAKPREGKALPDIARLIDLSRPLLSFGPEIVSRTCGVPIDEVRGWYFDKTGAIFLTILIQNADRLKNFFGLGSTLLNTMSRV